MFWFKREEKAALDAAVKAHAKPATSLIVEKQVEKGHVFSATETHFGGNPYFEEDDVWPIAGNNDHPYDFVCQINLNQCPVRPDVPFDLFTVFYCWELESEGVEESCLVRTYYEAADAKATVIPRPKAIHSRTYRVRPCTVRTEIFDTYPWRMNEYPDILKAASKFSNPDAAYRASLRRLSFNEERSRVGGFPSWIHDNTLEYDDLVFVAQIEYEPKANNCIGDAAPIYIAISASNPNRVEIDSFQSG